MKVDNLTKYRTADLRALLYWVARREGHSADYTKKLQVEVRLARTRHSWNALGGRPFLTLWVPGPKELDVAAVASLAACAMMCSHNPAWTAPARGRYAYAERAVHWAKAPGLGVEGAPAKLPRGPHRTALEGLVKAEGKVAEYERKVRRYEGLLKKWRKKARYYEGRVDVTSREGLGRG